MCIWRGVGSYDFRYEWGELCFMAIVCDGQVTSDILEEPKSSVPPGQDFRPLLT